MESGLGLGKCCVLLLLIVVCLLPASLAYVHSMSKDDMAYMERHFPRSKRDIGDLRVPINYANLPRMDVVTIATEPYTFIEKDPSGVGEVTSGYMVDLMYLVGRRLGVQVHFYTSPDGTYGRLDPNTGEWTGIIGEVIKRENTIRENKTATGNDAIGLYGADITAAPLTITAPREEVVDFVKPFKHLGLTALMVKSNLGDDGWPYVFSIFRPLAIEVWISVIVIGIAVWVFMFLMNRFNPYEYGLRMHNNQATESEGELFNLAGSFWFMFTILQWQGYERSPRCLASKILGAFWMLFVTIFLVVFTGAYINNLFWASMVHGVDPNAPPITSLEDLASGQYGYSYGCVTGGSTYRYLTEVAKGDEYQVIGEYLRSNPDLLVASNEEGIAKVRELPKYAFLMETMSAKYAMNTKPCDLTTMPKMFGSRSYGLAVAINSPLLEDLHGIILEMIEEGDIEALEQKWFEIKGECWNVTKADEEKTRQSEVLFNKPKTVSFYMLYQVFVMMFVGVVISGCVALGEILWFNFRGKYTTTSRQNEDQPQQQILPNDNNVLMS